VFEVSNATVDTNIITTINIEYTLFVTDDLSRKNIRTNITTIETV
jgi:hypothetical protein